MTKSKLTAIIEQSIIIALKNSDAQLLAVQCKGNPVNIEAK